MNYFYNKILYLTSDVNNNQSNANKWKLVNVRFKLEIVLTKLHKMHTISTSERMQIYYIFSNNKTIFLIKFSYSLKKKKQKT